MKKRLTFLLINSRSGRQYRFSLNRKLFYFSIFFLLFLIAVGATGVWKARENLELIEQRHVLEARQQQMRSIEKTVKIIKKDEIAIRHLLGLDETAELPSARPKSE